MLKKTILPLLLIFILNATNAQLAPPSAEDIMKEAYTIAKKDLSNESENKKVFVIFHASWCVWCRKMDTSINDAACKKMFDDNFVIRHLTVFESKGKENLENPGALDMLKKYKGEEMGIPFWLIFDADGKLLADAKIRPAGAGMEAEGKNCGCPASKEEVDYFIEVLKKTTSLKEKELKVISERFSKNK